MREDSPPTKKPARVGSHAGQQRAGGESAVMSPESRTTKWRSRQFGDVAPWRLGGRERDSTKPSISGKATPTSTSERIYSVVAMEHRAPPTGKQEATG
jgi:hypothetical protein